MKLLTMSFFLVVTLATASIDHRSTYIDTYDETALNLTVVYISMFAISFLQCVHACLFREGCSGGRHSDARQVNKTCALYGNMSKQVKQNGENGNVWNISDHTVLFHMFVLTEQNNEWNAWDSCKQFFQVYSKQQSSIVWLKGMGNHYCRQNISNCGEGGWTLLMKIDGSQNTFRYDSELWTNNAIYNTENCLPEIKAGHQECKFHAYNKMAVRQLCIGMKVSTSLAWLKLVYKGDSLNSLIKPGAFKQTNLGRAAWKKLINGSSLQLYCNREGLNIQSYTINARIGIIGNEDKDCNYPDSVLGFGFSYGSECLPKPSNVSTGNIAYCTTDNGDHTLSALAFIYGG